MLTEAALITISCVLFIQMGLADAIPKALHIRLKIVPCPKCLTFWVCLGWMVWHKYGLIQSVAASFLSSYCALWLALLYDALALLYNYMYEQITQTNDTPAATQVTGSEPGPEPPADEVP